MAKRLLDFDQERQLKKDLFVLMSRLTEEVEQERSDEEQAMAELEAFAKAYGLSLEQMKPFMDDALLKIQSQRLQSKTKGASSEDEFCED